MREQQCGNCKWWGRDEPRPVNFAPCRAPMPEGVTDYILRTAGDMLAFMKISSAGGTCPVWEHEGLNEQTAWLIECGMDYYCSDGVWCNNPNHAFKFLTEESAREKAKGMKTMEPVTVSEHGWSGNE